jgi:small subunit ribosomal protein S30e
LLSFSRTPVASPSRATSLCSNLDYFFRVFSPPATMSKVHGSLARAGKVRGQTPKVAKQDKKKKPTGRAHKRMQYNRRFVTAGTPQETSTFSCPVFFVFQAYTIWVRVFHLALEFFHVSLFSFDTRQCFSFFLCSCWIWQEEGP